MNGNNRGGFRPRSSSGMGGGSGDFHRTFAPVKVGEELDVKIEAVGEKGDGVAKIKGFVLFVPGVKQGEDVKIKVTKVLKNVGFAEVVGPATPRPEGEEAPAEVQKEEASEEESEEKEEAPSKEDSDNFGDGESQEETTEDTEDDFDEFQEDTEETSEEEEQ